MPLQGATALVGIRWARVQSSPFAQVVSEELGSDGALGFPDLECLANAQQILISSPEMLAMESGTFPAATVREQAVSKGWKRSSYRGVELWITPGKETLSIAQVSDQLVLLGRVKTLQDAIDRSLVETGRACSPYFAGRALLTEELVEWWHPRLPNRRRTYSCPSTSKADAFARRVATEEWVAPEASVQRGRTLMQPGPPTRCGTTFRPCHRSGVG